MMKFDHAHQHVHASTTRKTDISNVRFKTFSNSTKHALHIFSLAETNHRDLVGPHWLSSSYSSPLCGSLIFLTKIYAIFQVL